MAMTSRKNDERARIRAARYVPGHGFEAAVEKTLNNLPRRKHASLKNRVLAASSVAAALLLLLVFTAPQIVRAAAQLYQRLFGQVVADIKAEQALPEDEKLKAMTADYERWSRWHNVEGASAEIEGVTVSVASVRTMPRDQSDANSAEGRLDLTLTFSKIPPFDPSRVDFTIAADGVEIPMKIDGSFKTYRDEGGRTLTKKEWKADWSASNCYLQGAVPTTWLKFDVDDWRWEKPRALILAAMIDGQELSIPFTFDPVKAHEQAVEMAKISLTLGEENYQHEKDSLESMETAAVPVGLTGSAQGHDWTISELSYADEKLYFTVAFGGIQEEQPQQVAMGFWLGDVTVDGMKVGLGGSDNDKLKDKNYTAIYQYPLGRDPRNLPEESLIKLTLEFGSEESRQDAAFKYNWREKKTTLPRDEAEMQAWAGQARTLEEKLYGRYPADIGYDLTPLHLAQEKDGVMMLIIGAKFRAGVERLEFLVKFDGDLASSPYDWEAEPEVTINGYRCYNDGSSGREDDSGQDIPTAYHVCPPLNISELGNGDKVVFEFPLYDVKAYDGTTNYPKPVDTLRYEFTIDKDELKPLKADD
jgi:hypothetical protein